MIRRDFLRAVAAPAAAGIAALAACDVREFAYRHGARRRLSLATGGTAGVWYVYGGAIAKVISSHLPGVEVTPELTGGATDNLKLLARGAVDLACVTSDALDDALRRRGPFAGGAAVPAMTLVSLYGAPLHLATFADTGIAHLADLRGRHVSTGAPGAGTETMALRVLAAGGLHPDRDVRRERLSFSASVEAMKDGKLDACFFGVGVPNPAMTDLSRTPGRRFRLVPLGEVRTALQQAYGVQVYYAYDIPRSAYPGLDADVPTLGFDNFLVVDERLEETLAHDITRALFDYRSELVAVHPIARELTHASATRASPAPFHPGAISYFREVGAWHG